MQTRYFRLTDDEYAAVIGHEWFAALPEGVQEQVLSASSVRRYSHGELIALRGEEPCHWIGCARGSVCVSSMDQDAKPFTLTYVPAGVWFGDPGLFDGRRSTHDAHAHGATTLLMLPRQRLDALLQSNADFSRALLVLQAKWTRVLYRFLQQANTSPLEVRLVRQLVALARLHGKAGREDGESRIGLALHQEEIAQMIGASRQRVNRHLKQLERAGHIRLGKREISVRDLDALNAFAVHTNDAGSESRHGPPAKVAARQSARAKPKPSPQPSMRP